MAILKDGFDSKEYRLFVKDYPCIICLKTSEIDAHHWRTKAAHGNDFYCVPLCREHHQMFHANGRVKFCLMNRIKEEYPYQCMVKMITNFVLNTYVKGKS